MIHLLQRKAADTADTGIVTLYFPAITLTPPPNNANLEMCSLLVIGDKCWQKLSVMFAAVEAASTPDFSTFARTCRSATL